MSWVMSNLCTLINWLTNWLEIVITYLMIAHLRNKNSINKIKVILFFYGLLFDSIAKFCINIKQLINLIIKSVY